MTMTLAEAFAERPGRFALLDAGVRAAGWGGKPLHLLEVGCAEGDGAARLVGMEPVRVTAVDINPALIARASEKHAGAGPACVFVCADAGRLPFEDGSFDGAYSEAAFSPAEDKAAVVSEYARVLRPGGRVLLNDYALRGEPEEALRGCGREIPCLWGVRSSADYRHIFEAAGFSLLSETEEYGELVKLVLWLNRAYGPGGYLELVRKTWGRPEQDVSAFFRQAKMTYCQMVFERNE